ncbi:hypothetical protein AAFF_G00381070 [Aldrovandia affinis]|uniref:Uncharacterized protein n=1 Tax=Aldrovandia affinis TaxID=143900 RepID=A0AAD7X0T2_9TELE|nr:hypothetical protein AAFF_G00381070 [Aldrovandia affinis]
MIQQLARLPVARPHTVSEAVVDTVTRLFRMVMDYSEEPFNLKSSSRLLSGVAVGQRKGHSGARGFSQMETKIETKDFPSS